MAQQENEIDKLFESLPKEDKQELDIFNEKPEPGKEEEPVKPEVKSEEDEPRKNRRHRRLEQQLVQEREARIRAEARAEAREELESKGPKEPGEVDERWLRMYGDTPEARTAWKLNQELLRDYTKNLKEEALEEIRNESRESDRQTQEFERFIDSELESIEDEFNVDVTSDAPAARKARREFLELVQNLSPKDQDGTITGYADFSAAWEMYQLKRGSQETKPDASRNKEVASRSMEKSGSSGNGEKPVTSGFRGWMKDYNL